MLVQGESRQELSGAAGSALTFGMQVPRGQSRLTVSLTNAAQVDLYVRLGAQPTTSLYHCRSQTTASVEECRIDAPAEGMWFITVRGTSAYTGVTLTAYTTPIPEPAVTVLTSGQQVTDLAMAEGDLRSFSIEVPPGQARLAFELTGGTGDAALLAGFGNKPWPGSAECTGTPQAGAASCVFNAPRAGTWFVTVQAKSALSGFKLKGTHTATGDAVPTVLALGEWSPVLSGSPLQDGLFRIDVPEGQVSFKVELSGTAGLADFYLEHGTRPTPSDFWCAGSTASPCTVTYPEPGPWYVRLRGSGTYADHRLRGTFTPVVSLTPGVPLALSGQYRETVYFRVEVPPGLPGLKVATTPADSRMSLSLRYGAWRDAPEATCEYNACDATRPQAGTWYGTLYFSQAVSDTQLLATLEQGPISPLTDNAPVDVSFAAGSLQYYQFEVPPGLDYVMVDLLARDPATSAAKLYVQQGYEPTTSDFRCWDTIWAADDVSIRCIVYSPQAGPWFALVAARDALTGALRVTSSKTPRLANGWPEPPSAGAQNSERLWTLEVPEGRSDLLVRLTETPYPWAPRGSGDTALLVKRGGIPNSADFDCKSDNPDSFMEACALTNPLPGTWYVLVRGKLAYSDVRVEASHAGTPGEGVDALENGVARVNLTGRRHAYRLWKLEVPAGQRRLEFDLSGGTGDMDLYVQHGTRPTSTNALCHAAPSASGQRCVIDNPQAGTWFALARAASDYRGFFLSGRYSKDGDVTPLTPHLPVPNLTSEGSIPRLFSMTVPAGRSKLRFHLSGDLEHVTLRVKQGAAPTATDPVCRTVYDVKAVDCDVSSPVAGTYYLLLMGTYQGAALTGVDQQTQTVSAIEPLLNGSATRLETEMTDTRYFMLYVPAGAKSLKVSTAGFPKYTTGGTNLLVRRGEVPYSSSNDCSSLLVGTDDACAIENPQEGLWYIGVYGTLSTVVDLRVMHE